MLYDSLKDHKSFGYNFRSDDVIIFFYCTGVADMTVNTYMSFQVITANFATDIEWKCIFDIFEPAARGRSNNVWRHCV